MGKENNIHGSYRIQLLPMMTLSLFTFFDREAKMRARESTTPPTISIMASMLITCIGSLDWISLLKEEKTLLRLWLLYPCTKDCETSILH